VSAVAGTGDLSEYHWLKDPDVFTSDGYIYQNCIQQGYMILSAHRIEAYKTDDVNFSTGICFKSIVAFARATGVDAKGNPTAFTGSFGGMLILNPARGGRIETIEIDPLGAVGPHHDIFISNW
jgi:hypothetical protein